MPPELDHVSQVEGLWLSASPIRFPLPLCLRWQENPLPPTNPTAEEPRARANPSSFVHVIGHLHLCTVTGSFADLSEEEAEARRPSRSCFVRGSSLWPVPARFVIRAARSLGCSARASRRGLRECAAPASSQLQGPAGSQDAARASSVRLLSLSSPTLNAPLPCPPPPIGWPEAERLSAAPIGARFPTGFRGPAPEARWPRSPDSSHWQTASGPEG